MLKMVFHYQWVSWIMECVFSVNYYVLINWVPHKRSKPSKGIDRVIFYLLTYLFYVLKLSLACYWRLTTQGKFPAFWLGGNVRVSHLFFANDSLIFCQANSTIWSRMLSLISTCEQASSQLLNKEKSSIFLAPTLLMK